jgi:hypothetical protein
MIQSRYLFFTTEIVGQFSVLEGTTLAPALQNIKKKKDRCKKRTGRREREETMNNLNSLMGRLVRGRSHGVMGLV